MSEKYDVVVIGAGPGGYPAAIRAAQLEKKVVIIEKEYIGGECLNWGCIPSKNLVSAANTYHKTKTEIDSMGIKVRDIELDFDKLQRWKQGITKKLTNGIEYLFKANGVDKIIGTAKILSHNQVEVTLDNDIRIIETENIILATGAKFKEHTMLKIDGEQILTPKEAVNLREIPTSLLFVGASPYGIELATVFAKLGSQVTILVEKREFLPEVDTSIAKFILRDLKRLGVVVMKNIKISSITKHKDSVQLDIETSKESKQFKTSKIILTTGKTPCIDCIDVKELGIKLTVQGYIETNDRMQTNVEHVYAVGDVTGPPYLAHRATKQAIVAAEVIVGLTSAYDHVALPKVIYGAPEVASVGLSEQDAKEAGYTITTAKVSMSASGRALGLLEPKGFVKIVSDKETKVILGVHIVGPNASDMIGEATLSLEMGATLEDIGFTAHPHPSIGEMIMEAAEAAQGKATHVVNR